MYLNKHLRNNIKLLSLYNAFYNFRLHSVVAIIYFAQITHSYALAISLFSIAQIAQAVLEVPSGIYSDRLGRSNCLKIGAFASLLSIIFYACGRSYLLLAIGAVFDGVNRAFFSGNNDALLYETLNSTRQKERYHHELGRVNSNLELAGFISAIVGSVFAIKSLQLLFLISIIPQFFGLIVSFWFVEPLEIRGNVESVFLHLKSALKNYRKNANIRHISLASIIGFGVGEASWSFQAVFYHSLLPVWAVSLMMSLNYLASTISFRLSGKIINKIKAINVLIYQEIYSRVLNIVALVYPTIFSPVIMAVSSLSYGPSTVAKSTLLQKEFTDKQRATMVSINSLVGSCFFAVFAVLIGLFADKFGPAKSLLLAQLCLLPVIYFYIKVKRKGSQTQ